MSRRTVSFATAKFPGHGYPLHESELEDCHGVREEEHCASQVEIGLKDDA